MQLYQWRGSCAVSSAVTSASLLLIYVLASPAYQGVGIWGKVLSQTLSIAPFVFTAQILFSLCTALTSLLDFVFFHPPPRLWLPAYLCCRLNFLIDILTFPLLLTYLRPLLVSKSCSFKTSVLFYLWKRITVFHSMFFMLLPRPSTAPVNHPKYATLQVPCSSILWASLVEFSSWGHLASWSCASFLWYSLFST